MDKFKYEIIFCFFKKLVEETKKLCRCKVPEISEITKESKEGESFSIQKLNSFTCCNFKDTPFVFCIKENVDRLLSRAISKLSTSFGITVKIGIELEFFSENDFDDLAETCKVFCVKNDIKILNCVKECVKNQYEVQFDIYDDVFLLAECFSRLKLFLIKNFKANFQAKPYYFSAGSALQINLSLEKNKKNIFGENGGDIFVQKSVNGLIYYTNYFLSFYIKCENCLDRYEEVFNRYVYDKGLIPSPSFNSCGLNNRTASIRIPNPKNFRDKEEYAMENRQNKRIEFRIPSSDCDIKLALYGALTSVYIGLKKKQPDIEFTSNNLLLNNVGHERICIKNFSFRDIEEEDDFF
jgi:glutamine synthetase